MIKDSIIVALQAAQARDKYLTRDTINAVAKRFHVSPSEVYAIASFYHQFTFTPQGEHVIAVCMGTACFITGASAILQMIEQELGIKEGEITPDGKFSLTKNTRCLGRCAAAPLVQIDDTIYEHATVEQIKEVIHGLR